MKFYLGLISIYQNWKTKIILLLNKKVTVLAKYSGFVKIFIKKLAAKLLKYLNINKYIINLELGKQLFYRPIYIFEPIKLEIFKIYIKTNLANKFI